MGKLVEQSIKTLYQGVSRQPDPVRLPGQVEEADNILVSVVTGGFESRPASRHIAAMAGIAPEDTPAVYAYSRDNLEQYMIIINNGDLRVYDLDGVEKTVVFSDADEANGITGKEYIDGLGQQDVAFVTIADYTIIANRNKTVQMLPSAYVPINDALVNCRVTNSSTAYEIWIHTDLDNPNGKTSTRVWNYSVTNAVSATAVADHIMSNMSLPAGFTKERLDTTIYIVGNQEFEIEQRGADDTYGPWAMGDVVSGRELLPNSAPEGYPIRVGGNIDGDQYGYWAKYSKDDGGWVECPDPYEQNEFDHDTMPHFLIRQADGTFEFRQGEYPPRIAGDIETVPHPDFVDNEITSVVFHRNRLGFVSGETVFFSQSGKYFTFWPDFSTQSLDSDAFGLTASSETVNNLQHAVGFRKSLFLTSNKAQFEVSGTQLLSPSTASVDLSTTYLTEKKCKPITLGNTLYFAAQSGRDAIVFEYQYDDTSVSNVASDITLHALSYIPAPIIRMTGDPTNDMIMLLTEEDQQSLYVYKMYVDGDTKAQSAWMRWTYGDNTKIKWMEVIDGQLYMLLSRGDEVFFERTFLRYELTAEKHPYQVSMDRQVRIVGNYDPATNKTTWTLPYKHFNNSRVVLSTDFPVGLVGEVLTTAYSDEYTLSADGNYSGGDAIIGTVYVSRVMLSKLYPRDPQNMRSTITSGRFQLRNITFNYKQSGFFKVRITPEFRDSRTHAFTGRIVGSGDSRIGIPAISSLGAFRVPVMSRGDTVKVEVLNDSEKPMNITSIDYVGFFNELTRQG
jgi:hypothetical protein